MRSLYFANRNLKEIVRDPLSLIFNAGFPVLMLFVFQLITGALPEEAMQATPQFQIDRLAPALAVFGFSFITLFSGMLISKDRTTSFLARLRTSPLTSTQFLIGYTLPMIPIALAQVVICYSLSFIFGLKLTGGLLLSIVSMIPIAIFFIALGLLLGTAFNDKAIGGVASIIINLSAIMGGMFMPLETLTGAFHDVAYMLPFANSLKLTSCVINGDYANMVKPLIIVLAYTVVIVVLAIVLFKKKMSSDKI